MSDEPLVFWVRLLNGTCFNDLERAVRKVLATDIGTERSIGEKEENDRRAAVRIRKRCEWQWKNTFLIL